MENKANVDLVRNLKIFNGTKGKAQRVRVGTSARLHGRVSTIKEVPRQLPEDIPEPGGGGGCSFPAWGVPHQMPPT